ncbi:hypothetical protein OG897_06085 [Streptomyces sp. NBC_00237]|uniref:hypothetical protein n=1 Tax=Streptomyces sp. NBC_00237 TaxID=2975687 RepID=UPI00225AD17C|nr:hypothetical protein [Streptomyces sp. NBC_00237]MCX5201030.1 hypothetical protein [Streptomyces sp. NBC_00237]
MTRCPSRDGDGHQFPDEDETGAYCEPHGVTLLFYGDPITDADLPDEVSERDADRVSDEE